MQPLGSVNQFPKRFHVMHVILGPFDNLFHDDIPLR